MELISCPCGTSNIQVCISSLTVIIFLDFQVQVFGLGRSDCCRFHAYRGVCPEDRRRPNEVGEAAGDQGRSDGPLHPKATVHAPQRSPAADGGVE